MQEVCETCTDDASCKSKQCATDRGYCVPAGFPSFICTKPQPPQYDWGKHCLTDSDCFQKRCIANTCRKNDGTCKYGTPNDPDCGTLQRCNVNGFCVDMPDSCTVHWNFCTLHKEGQDFNYERWLPPNYWSWNNECGACTTACTGKDETKKAECAGIITSEALGIPALLAAFAASCPETGCMTALIAGLTKAAPADLATVSALETESGYVTFEQLDLKARQAKAQQMLHDFGLFRRYS